MAVTPDYVREVFKGLENGDGDPQGTGLAAQGKEQLASPAARVVSPRSKRSRARRRGSQV